MAPDHIVRRCHWWTEYETFFLNSLISKEAQRPHLKLTSPQIKYRGYMVVSLRYAVKKLHLGDCVLHSAVRLLDYFMDNHNINIDQLRTVAFTCLYVAAKFELEGRSLPSYIKICKAGNVEKLPQQKLIDLEFLILNNIRWDMMMPNITTYLDFYRRFALTSEDYETESNAIPRPISFLALEQSLHKKLNEYLSVTLQDVQLTIFAPSLLAMSCLLAARRCHGLMIWPKEYDNFSNYSHEDIAKISTRITKMLDITNCSPNLKKRYQTHYSEDEDDQGYCTGKSSPEISSPKRVKRIRLLPKQDLKNDCPTVILE